MWYSPSKGNEMIEIIKAYIAGKTIEYREKCREDMPWTAKNECKGDIAFYPKDFEYRIKPDIVVRYVLAAHFEDTIKDKRTICASKPYLHDNIASNSKVIKLTFQDNVLTKAEVI